jgi:hypothetical protein
MHVGAPNAAPPIPRAGHRAPSTERGKARVTEDDVHRRKASETAEATGWGTGMARDPARRRRGLQVLVQARRVRSRHLRASEPDDPTEADAVRQEHDGSLSLAELHRRASACVADRLRCRHG